MSILVQKFGGTSVASAEGRERAIERIIEAKEKGYQVVVVVSAMGRKGAPYATDTLISLLKDISLEVNPREQDLLIACGEIISSVIMAHNLKALGHDAVAFTGAQAGIITDGAFGKGEILEITPKGILKELEENKIVVVAGFQGVSTEGQVTTLGRGGSDTTATALGVALKAECVEIFTDVDGIMTVDPRMVPEAKILDEVTYKEICEMAHQGAKVIHPRAVEVAMAEQVPIMIKNTFSEARGTLIADSAAERVITGLASLNGLAQVEISDYNGKDSQLAKVEVLRVLASNNISIDLINVSHKGMFFTVEEEKADKAQTLLYEAGFPCEVTKGCAKLSVVGAGMQGIPGVMADLVETLHQAGIKILQTSDSDITVSFLVPETQIKEAINLLHNKFTLKI